MRKTRSLVRVGEKTLPEAGDLHLRELQKWLRALEFTNHNVRGFWEVRGYHIHADPWPEERYSYQEGPRAELEP